MYYSLLSCVGLCTAAPRCLIYRLLASQNERLICVSHIKGLVEAVALMGHLRSRSQRDCNLRPYDPPSAPQLERDHAGTHQVIARAAHGRTLMRHTQSTGGAGVDGGFASKGALSQARALGRASMEGRVLMEQAPRRAIS